MRKLTLLKKLGIGLAPVAIATPLIFTTTSCSKTNAVLTTFISYDEIKNNQSLAHMSRGNFTNDEILLGSKKFFGGNYILLIGSNAYAIDDKTGTPSNTALFFGDSFNSRSVEEWFTTCFASSVWNRDSQTANSLELNRDFGFVTYIDNFNFRFYDGSREIYIAKDAAKGITLQNFGPFDKWTSELLAQTRLFNDGWDKDEKVTENDYIRQDAQAVAFRAFMQRGTMMFPTTESRTKTFDTSDNNKASLMAVYKDGRLVDIIDMPTKEKTDPDPEHKDRETTTLYGTINKYFTDEEEK